MGNDKQWVEHEQFRLYLLCKIKDLLHPEVTGSIGTLKEARRVGGGHLLQPLA